MSAQKWMKWLSVIALILVGSSVLAELGGMFGLFGNNVAQLNSTELTTLLLAIVAVIISFKKK